MGSSNGVFNRYYDGVCYAPLYLFAGGICWQQLRPSSDPAAGALDELRRILPQIRQRWPQVQLIVRGQCYARRHHELVKHARLIMCLV